MIKKLKYSFDEVGNIRLPNEPPFDEKPYLIKLDSGWCEAFWVPASQWDGPNGREYGGFYWCCLDDKFMADLDDALEWTILPVSSEDKEKTS